MYRQHQCFSDHESEYKVISCIVCVYFVILYCKSDSCICKKALLEGFIYNFANCNEKQEQYVVNLGTKHL